MTMDAAGWVIGKQGRRVADLQRATGALIRLANGGTGLPGMRCGDRLIEITAADASVRAAGLKAVFETLAEAPKEIRSVAPSLLIPDSSIGYVIGKGGQSVKEIVARTGVDVIVNSDSNLVAGARCVRFSEPTIGVSTSEAILALVEKVDELRERLATGSRGSGGYTDAASGFKHNTSGGGSAQGFPRAQSHMGSPMDSTGSSPLPLGASEFFTDGRSQTASELALLKGIQASGVLDHKLTIQVPRVVLDCLDIQDLERRSGARLEISGESPDGSHLLVSAVGQRVSTALATLYFQEAMAICERT
eukprot:TRINITY_DN14380_c0_g4_i1.p1 TRINITY_DN14380_c0_g4~~TRINITY_DN14380_c0_g4_i1.p1  ORF type:complete len:357 (+),score=66.99 TRINITY_DN14380_c0_g4_i1:158-1072(+)